MAEKATIARPYARAAFEYAHANGQLAQWSGTLAVAAAVVSDATVRPLLSHPRVSAEQLVQLIADVGGARIAAPANGFLATLAANRRLALLPQIAAQYETLRAAAENVADVEVTSAVALDEAQRQRLTQALAKRLRHNVRLHCAIDPALLGGAVIRYGDLVIDGSLKARLQRLTTAISN